MSFMRGSVKAGMVAATILAGAIVSSPARATEVWSGRTLAFAKADFADPTLPSNQDRITANVWLTRGDMRGLYNIRQEAAYVAASPLDTEWATGNAANHATLTFQPWVVWAGNFPPNTVGVNAVVHLITDDIYVDIRFDGWTSMATGGGFSYHRGQPPNAVTPEAAAFSLRGFLGNPVEGDAQIAFSLPDAAPARLEVFDVAGRRIALRDVGDLGAGAHRVPIAELSGRQPGLLFVRLTRNGRSLVARATQLR